MSIDIYDFITPNKFKHFTIKGRIRSTVINLTACRVATAAPTPYSDPTRLIPLMPPGAHFLDGGLHRRGALLRIGRHHLADHAAPHSRGFCGRVSAA